ncbi:glycosyltransferase [Kaistella faecalis]|uniref:glycosyltransferase n=1 Tax=Kaistella faecalis TaxID=2852098 RepID=UPI001C454894|nr:glycosyltransferase [Chryseobacterium faecale]UFK97095.1 glycosyltransferase [Chryseobacterium faecale]
MQKKIKVLHVQETIGSGGVERTRLTLAKHLDKNLFDQKFVCTIAAGNIPEEISAEGFEVISIGQLKSPFQWMQHQKVQRIIEEYQPDIIHGAVFEGVTMAAINGWLKKVPVIIIEETSDPINRSWKGNLLMRFFSKISDKVIGVSQSVTEEYLKGKLGISYTKAFTINNGVAIPRIVLEEEKKQEKLKWGLGENDFVVGSTGRLLNSHKRFSDLIRAFASFAKCKEDAKLLLVGDGPDRKSYEQLAKDLGMSNQVIFTGYQSDVTLFYRMMNVFSLVSAREAFGLVLAEAMLNKLPVVATRVGGMKYIVDDQQTGFLAEPFQVDEFAEKFEFLYRNQETSEKMGDNGYRKAMANYTEDIYVNNIKNLYLNASENIKN